MTHGTQNDTEAKMRKYDRFTHRGVFKCEDCGRMTRETERNAGLDGLCPDCAELAMIQNGFSDSGNDPEYVAEYAGRSLALRKAIVLAGGTLHDGHTWAEANPLPLDTILNADTGQVEAPADTKTCKKCGHQRPLKGRCRECHKRTCAAWHKAKKAGQPTKKQTGRQAAAAVKRIAAADQARKRQALADNRRTSFFPIRAEIPNQTGLEKMTALQAISALAAEFQVVEPKLKWTNTRRGYYRWTGDGIIEMSSRGWRGIHTVIHEFAHHLDRLRCKNNPKMTHYVNRWGRVVSRMQHHGPSFYKALKDVVTVAYADPNLYPWASDYESIARRWERDAENPRNRAF